MKAIKALAHVDCSPTMGIAKDSWSICHAVVATTTTLIRRRYYLSTRKGSFLPVVGPAIADADADGTAH
ncbi:hypothetical protein GCM10010279_03200 [Streptomyces mutabilis]|nr:hypothetical protein GCM10010279_03200 [Streptomyces mutabilis]